MSVIPRERDPELRAQIERFAEILKTQAHLPGDHGLTEKGFYRPAIIGGAAGKVRGESSASMRGKREFAQPAPSHPELTAVLHRAFGSVDGEVNFVDVEVAEADGGLVRRTTIRRAGFVQHASGMTAIRRV